MIVGGLTIAAPMVHFAIAEALDGKAATWMEKVTDEQYRIGPLPRR